MLYPFFNSLNDNNLCALHLNPCPYLPCVLITCETRVQLMYESLTSKEILGLGNFQLLMYKFKSW